MNVREQILETELFSDNNYDLEGPTSFLNTLRGISLYNGSYANWFTTGNFL